MLKISPACNLSQQSKAKCGEIFCHSFTEFTIYCCFCDIKLFAFDDFLLHIQQVHFENNLLKTETITSDFVKTELIENIDDVDEYKEELVSESFSLSYDYDEYSCNVEDESREEDIKKVLSVPIKKVPKKDKNKIKIDIKSEKKSNLPKTRSQKNDAKPLTNSKKKQKVIEYSCSDCGEMFYQKKDLTQHMVEQHNGYKCTICDKRYRRTTHLTDHLKTHTSEKNFICPVENCGRGFIMEEYLKRHLEVHTMERTFICDFENCGKAFHTNRRLASHKFSHVKKFVCDMCGHGFRSSAELVTHLRVHTGEKPFPCEVCTKPFISKTALAEHMISHMETRPHVCPICNAAFANRRVLVRHSFIHSEEKAFKCKLCESAFKHPNSLQGHMRNVHREPKLK